MKLTTTLLLGVFIIVAALGLGFVSRMHPGPIKTGYVQSDVLKKADNGIETLKCNGFKVECYDSFVVIHVDKAKEPTWTGNYLLVIPWSKIENLTLMPE